MSSYFGLTNIVLYPLMLAIAGCKGENTAFRGKTTATGNLIRPNAATVEVEDGTGGTGGTGGGSGSGTNGSGTGANGANSSGTTTSASSANNAFARDIRVTCDSNNAIVPQVTPLRAINIPIICSEAREASSIKYPSMDLVFVLDSSGSMQPYVQMIRNNIVQIAASAVQKQYKVNFGAISFASSILDVQPMRADTSPLIDAMADANPLWKPADNATGIAVELGLGAIERGIELLATGNGESKTLVYFSDGPAKRLETDRFGLASSFYIANTAAKIRAFAQGLQAASGNFKFISGTSCTRGSSWFEEWPTPCNQITSLARNAGINHTPLTFPTTQINFDAEFMDKVENIVSTSYIDCVLDSVSIIQQGINVSVLPETKIPASSSTIGNWIIPIDSPVSGTYTMTINRKCGSEKKASKIQIVI